MLKLLTLMFLLSLFSCQSESLPKLGPNFKTQLITPAGEVIRARIAVSPKEQQQGLSGIQPEEFSEDEAMLFFYKEESEKLFWMPDTYFNIDIFYLSNNLTILDIVRKLPFYKGRINPEMIPRARSVWARHALEMKSDSEISKSLKIGDQLTWRGTPALKEVEELAQKF